MKNLLLVAAITFAASGVRADDWLEGSAALAALSQEAANAPRCAPDVLEAMYKQLWSLEADLRQLALNNLMWEQEIRNYLGRVRETAQRHAATGEPVTPDILSWSDAEIAAYFISGRSVRLDYRTGATGGYYNGREVQQAARMIAANRDNKPLFEEQIKELRAAIQRRSSR